MTLTWAYTAQVAAILLTIALVGLGWLRWLARDFDRKYGQRYGDDARKPPAE